MLTIKFDRLGVQRGESFEHIHGLIEAAKRAFEVRDREIRDPDHAGEIARYLEAEWLDEAAARIDMKRAAAWPTCWQPMRSRPCSRTGT